MRNAMNHAPARALWVCSMTRLSADKTTALLVYFCHVFFFVWSEKKDAVF